MIATLEIHNGDCIEVMRSMPDESVHCCVTSPPYWSLRDYGVDGQIGLEETLDKWVAQIVTVFREVRRVLRSDGVCWLNLGDSYSQNIEPGFNSNANRPESARCTRLRCHLPPKQLLGQPWRVAFALQADGWWLRQDIIWHKPNPMPESVRDRCTKAHEYLFLLTKSDRYWWDWEAIAEPSIHAGELRVRRGSKKNFCPVKQRTVPKGTRIVPEKRNKRSVWTVPTVPYYEAHFATYPPDLIKPCILAGCPAGGTVLDPFAGSGTTGQVALELGRSAVLIELNPEYVKLIHKRCNVTPGFKMQ